MKKLLTSLLTVSLLTIPVLSVQAHPGRTASDGMHYCRTNCDYWGVPWNKRHGHGGSSTSSSSNTKSTTQKPTATKVSKPTVVYKTITALKDTPVYSQPIAQSEYLVRTIPYGTLLNDSGGTNGWNTIKQSDNTTVYVSKNHTTLYTPYEGYQNLFEVKAEKGYVFPAPLATSNATGSLPQGTLVTIVGSYGEWYYIEASHNGQEVKGFMKNTIVGSLY